MKSGAVMKQVALVGLAVVAMLATGCPSKTEAYEDVSVAEGYALWQDGVFVLDVRTTEEYAEGHVPDAYNLNVNELATRMAEIEAYKDYDVLVYCKGGTRSAIASKELAETYGFTKIHNMLGGFEAWKAAGYETAK